MNAPSLFSLPCPAGLALAAALLIQLPAHAGYDDGLQAYRAGRYDIALKEFSQAANRGDARAQRSLGLMHERGDGVPADARIAAQWYGRAVEQGLDAAQFNLAFVQTLPTATADVRLAAHR